MKRLITTPPLRAFVDLPCVAHLRWSLPESRGYCLEMIWADFLAGAHLDNGDPDILLNSIARYYKFLPCEQQQVFIENLREKAFLRMIRPRAAPLRPDPLLYESLRQQILRRDGWRCQSCGSLSSLEVHHREFRSRLGADTEENLITLCTACHARVHRR